MNKAAHHNILTECLALLASNDVKLHETTASLIEHFFAHDSHSSLEDLEQHMRQSGATLSHEEIRRTMKLLVEYGFASEKIFGDGKTRYEHLHVGEHHDHLYCQKCGRIIEFTCPLIEEQQTEVARRYGFHPFSHKMQINGLCAECFGHDAVSAVPLDSLHPGAHFRVVEVDHGSRWHRFGRHRLFEELGVVPSLEGEVLSSSPGLITLLIKGARVALPRRYGRSVGVVLLNKSEQRKVERKLSACCEGERVTIVRVEGAGPFRKRLLEMGFMKGSQLRIVRHAPLRDPLEVEVKGSRVSLRRSEAERIEVK